MHVRSASLRSRSATLVSEAIRPILKRPGSAVVHSVFRSAINLETAGALVTLADAGVGPLPNGLIVDLGPDARRVGIRPGTRVVFEDRAILFPDAGIAIDLRIARRWDPRLPWHRAAGLAAAGHWRQAAARRRRLVAVAAALLPGARIGLGELMPADGTATDGMILRVARPALERLEMALRIGDVGAAGHAARGLVGLGPGLTPSGDDALVGVAAAACALGGPGAAGFLRPIVADAAVRTTMVGATFLRHAAQGQFAERLHRLLPALLAEDDRPLGPAIDAALAWGASSGADTLVGVLLGLDAIAGVGQAAGVSRDQVAA